MKINGLPTPALIVDVNVLKCNVDKMKRLLEGSKLSLRPHYKSHKCASIAKWQIENGAIGMTCAKLSEAEDLCDTGIEDILIANQIVEPCKINRLADLALNCRLSVCVDSIENIRALSASAVHSGSTIYCLVEYDIGMQRCGVTSKEEVLTLAKEINACKNLVFKGIQAYAGHISHIENLNERKDATTENYKKLNELLTYLNKHNITVETVSGGSTGTAAIKAREGLYTELQAGSYLFMDATYKTLNLPFENSLYLLTTVVSKRDGITVIDAGVKTCGIDQGMPKVLGKSIKEVVASEEHFQLHGYNGNESVGEKLLLTPAHCCSTINLHDKIYLVDGDKVIDRIPITARKIGR